MRETVKDSRRTALQRALLLDLLAQTAFLFWDRIKQRED